MSREERRIRRERSLKKITKGVKEKEWFYWAVGEYFAWSKNHLMMHGVWDVSWRWGDVSAHHLRWSPQFPESPEKLSMVLSDDPEQGARFTYDPRTLEWSKKNHALPLPTHLFHAYLQREQFVTLSMCLRRRRMGFALLAIRPFCLIRK